MAARVVCLSKLIHKCMRGTFKLLYLSSYEFFFFFSALPSLKARIPAVRRYSTP